MWCKVGRAPRVSHLLVYEDECTSSKICKISCRSADRQSGWKIVEQATIQGRHLEGYGGEALGGIWGRAESPNKRTSEWLHFYVEC